ncbi:carbohydrate ABC transporter permease [Paenibacillus piri]|uniref:Sugar ABC transporter permease n=1 Tax=Paenibacillus piri TaxID=2547395 RepID=A0A4R5KL04_9BACL|nr:sugar ABC transporter permease [Paenibacillus piri]TDF95120.1 sugar ABC transporter permease [Paenibacillus piri]
MLSFKLNNRRRSLIAFYLFIGPWLIGYLAFTLGPILASGWLSFTNYDGVNPAAFIGLDNYREIWDSSLFWKSLWVTFYYTLGHVPLSVIGALCLAVLLNQKIPLLSLWRTIFYLPVVTSGVAVALLWSWIFQPSYGLINIFIYQVFGVQGPGWFFSDQWSVPAFIIMSLWGVGGPMLIYLAGLQGIPTQFYEAAEIDGAGAFKKFWHITLPMVTPVIFFNMVITIIMSFQVFTPAFVITKGGPNYSTYFYVLYLYQSAFENFRLGFASALAWILFAIILIITVLLFRWQRKWVHYESVR